MATDPDWKRKIFVGGLILLIPVIGWPAILGYRKVVVARLVDGVTPVLPDWHGKLGTYVLEGMKAIFVIYAYLSPVILWFAVRAHGSVAAEQLPWIYVASFLIAFPIFSPLAVPSLVTYLTWFTSEPFVSPWEGTCMLCMYSSITFMIPLGFLQVSYHGRIRAAFNLLAMLRLLSKSFLRYCEAWLGSAGISLIGHFAIPFSPWGVVWCYLAIVYAFNEVPWDARDNEETSYLSSSWISRMNKGYLDDYQQQRRLISTNYQISADDHSKTPHFTTLRFFCFEIPVG